MVDTNVATIILLLQVKIGALKLFEVFALLLAGAVNRNCNTYKDQSAGKADLPAKAKGVVLIAERNGMCAFGKRNCDHGIAD